MHLSTIPSRPAREVVAEDVVVVGVVTEAAIQAIAVTEGANLEAHLLAVAKAASATSSVEASLTVANPRGRDANARGMARGAHRRRTPRHARKRHRATWLE